MQIKEERQGAIEQEQKRINNLSYEEYERELKEIEREQRQARFNKKDKSKDSNHLILESNDKSIKIIFLDKLDLNQSSNVSSLREVGTTSWQSISTTQPNNLSLSNLLHLHNNKIDIFTKNGSEIDIAEIESLITNYKQRYTESSNQESKLTLDSLHSPDTQIFLYSQLLLGSKESPNNPLYFWELDNDGVFVESKPIYHLIGETDYDTKDSKENFTQTLQVFLNNFTLTILNYSILDSSLHIKLECKSKESKEIEDKEKALLESKAKDSKENKESISTAFLCPVLEDNELKCPHNGIVQLKSNKGKPFQSKGIPMILESDLMNSSIVGCTHTIAGVPTPCSLVSVILPSARAYKKYNDDYPIMQDLCVSGVLSDKGFPITCKPKNNTFKINAPNPSNTKEISKEALASAIKLTKPSIRLYYKEHREQIDNIPICRLRLNDRIIESSSDDDTLQNSNTPLRLLELDIHKDAKDLDSTIKLDKRASSSQSTHNITHTDNTTNSNNTNNTTNNNTKDSIPTPSDSTPSLLSLLLKDYPKDYEFKEIDITIGIHSIALMLIIPQKIPKVYDKAYKEYEYKDYGVGRYTQLLEYSKDIQDDREYVGGGETSLQSMFIVYNKNLINHNVESYLLESKRVV